MSIGNNERAEFARRRGRWMLVVIAALSFIPMLLAVVLIRHPEWINRQGNYGTLIVPPVTAGLGSLRLFDAAGGPGLKELEGRWALLYLARGGQCQSMCREALQKTHRVWLLLSKDLSRVRRALVATTPAMTDETLAREQQLEATLLVGRMDEAYWTRLHPDLALAGNEEGRLVLMDPLGNVLMHYPENFDPHGLFKDLVHLLKASQIG